MQHSLWLQNFIRVYSELGTDNLDTLNSIYHPQLVFIDPLHKVEGPERLIESFKASYSNIICCEFIIDNAFESGGQAAVYWQMRFCHRRLNSQEEIRITGHSHLLEQDGLIVYHRDYLDVGAMIYEHVPLLGALVKGLKKRAVKN